MNNPLQQIRAQLEIDPTAFAGVADVFRERTWAKGDYLLRRGQRRAGLSFVTRGYARMFAVDTDHGREITQWVGAPGTFVTDVAALFFDAPARWDIQMLQDGATLTVSHDDFGQIGERVPGWPVLERRFMAKCFQTLEERVYTHLAMSAEARYRTFLDAYPELFRTVPLHYLASMLGMTPETLSRLRRKVIS